MALNLDYQAARTAQQIVRQCEDAGTADNVITNALGVLQEMGIYAFFLFLHSRPNRDHKRVAGVISAETLHMLDAIGIPNINTGNQQIESILATVSEQVVNDLDTTLLVKQLTEQMLVYARYGAKAKKSGG